MRPKSRNKIFFMLDGKWQSFYKANKVNSWEEETTLFVGTHGQAPLRQKPQ